METHIIVRYSKECVNLYEHSTHTLHFYRLENFIRWCNEFNENRNKRIITSISFVRMVYKEF